MTSERANRWLIAAVTWTVGYAMAGLFWAWDGRGFPYAEVDNARSAGAVLLGLPPRVTGLVIAALGIGISVVAVTARLHRPASLMRVAWVVVAVLLLTIPDARLLLVLINLLMARIDHVTPGVINQIGVLLGAFLWWRTASAGRSPNLRQEGWSRRARAVWLAAVILPLFYAARQWAWALGLHIGVTDEFIEPYTAAGARITEAVLGAMTVGGALLTLGLKQSWGTRVPRWSPILPGRPIPKHLAIIPAGVVAVALSAAGLSVWRGLLAMSLGLTAREPSAAAENWAVWLPTLTWLPWGLALAGATIHYNRLRRIERLAS